MNAPGRTFRYEVGGMPSGKSVSIALFPHKDKWSILRYEGEDRGYWSGAYSTAAEALSALESEVNQDN